MCLAHEVKGEVEAAYDKAENVKARCKIMDQWCKHYRSRSNHFNLPFTQ
ncbi:hypothetical protein [Vibrio hippocampi]|uniref:Integrase n=1 Tax=Vibrio hippocampi TaxID=654686 RepID=A0ABM8ZI85_9VIBR|nr:hypothetical protein [Vibrio hippocampi]CAH0526235.1 hypothetical protein VHP8226_01698 [Vibrio hippocampi]